MTHKKKARTISIGPRGQALLKQFFTDEPTDYLFRPRRAAEEFRAARAAARKRAARANADARATRRARALLDLADGQTPAQVAARYRVGRSTVYERVARWSAAERPKPDRLRDADRSGRPPEQREAVARRLHELMPTAPTDHGYRHPTWTTPLLVAHLAREHGLEVSDTTVRRALHGLGYRWKRPRLVLSRRNPNWRPAKGGSSGD